MIIILNVDCHHRLMLQEEAQWFAGRLAVHEEEQVFRLGVWV